MQGMQCSPALSSNRILPSVFSPLGKLSISPRHKRVPSIGDAGLPVAVNSMVHQTYLGGDCALQLEHACTGSEAVLGWCWQRCR
ncbi:hypothetical protein PC116_g18704 [Phytophthora cactorum]|uniref:Uncharacterized protein n=1 Tax=Phytophthora cactorum TaxID=29920 RepID=A0A8T1CLC1_9STRA|nr:hypothetical protein PC111_g16003 [Phytophthora cactorum]KAG2852729.1 hypothetical protein PC113_g14776 [Phytophthora cactorum]KAG2894105.1 hypothetical protein PC114_g16033 [Phytophthora cactorum]KAG2924132.1 hypothetical protein PC117_g15463 [Phytophthora cactorum]KAG2970349.1 hypothetical protein PC118_g16930 [Phytophthora cactorum]